MVLALSGRTRAAHANRPADSCHAPQCKARDQTGEVFGVSRGRSDARRAGALDVCDRLIDPAGLEE